MVDEQAGSLIDYSMFCATYNITLFPLLSAPEEGPSSVECGGVTSSALRVSWQPIPPHKQAGALIGYTVLYAAQGKVQINNYFFPF